TPVATYLADSGFAGEDYEAHLAATYGVTLVATPQRGSRRRWPTAVRRWVARHRQIVETVIGRLLHTFGLERERPHTLAGFQARLAAKVALHNLCCWLNRQQERPLLAVANLITW
ncbi:MAG: transposase, partial [Sphaerobacter thermophilus]|uniref:transposase n=1 Tax=Sphaerobacter thermophilus TaxID=2057 RepID=UPI00396E4A79